MQNLQWDRELQRRFIVQTSIKRQLSLSQTLQSSRRNPASRPAHSPFTPRDAECQWEGHNRNYPMTVDFRHTKKLFHAAPLKWMDAELQQALWRYGNVWEGTRVSRPAISSWFWTNLSSRWMCSNAFLVNEMLTQQFIFYHLIFYIFFSLFIYSDLYIYRLLHR